MNRKNTKIWFDLKWAENDINISRTVQLIYGTYKVCIQSSPSHKETDLLLTILIKPIENTNLFSYV